MRPVQRHKRGELDSRESLRTHLATSADLDGVVVQALDLREVPEIDSVGVRDAIFLGCVFRDLEQQVDLVRRGASVFPSFEGLPYTPFRRTLYTVEELMEGEEDGGYTGTRDFRVYTHFDRERRDPRGISLRESLAQRIHDHAIDDALEEALAVHSGKGVVGVMGGHGTRRSDPYFLKVAQLAWRLARAGYFVASGGGPGIMEATNLGAYFANYSDPAVLEAVINALSEADEFDGGEEEGTPAYLEAVRKYFACGWRVLETYAGEGVSAEIVDRYGRERVEPGASLAIPTWFYGHEPSNLFSTHIAKYFSNSLREDGLLAIATAGVIYAPGSAGTLQEVFMDLAQNHYATFKLRSPMVFLGETYYEHILTLLRAFVDERGMQDVYGDLIVSSDDPKWIAEFVDAHPPRPRNEKAPLYELLEGGA